MHLAKLFYEIVACVVCLPVGEGGCLSFKCFIFLLMLLITVYYHYMTILPALATFLSMTVDLPLSPLYSKEKGTLLLPDYLVLLSFVFP